MVEGLQIQISENPCSWLLDVYFFRRVSQGVTLVVQADGTEVEYVDGSLEKPKPTFVATRETLSMLLNAINNKGIKTIDQGFTAGKLEATENHLEDLRTLLKLDQRIIISGTPKEKI